MAVSRDETDGFDSSPALGSVRLVSHETDHKKLWSCVLHYIEPLLFVIIGDMLGEGVWGGALALCQDWLSFIVALSPAIVSIVLFCFLICQGGVVAEYMLANFETNRAVDLFDLRTSSNKYKSCYHQFSRCCLLNVVNGCATVPLGAHCSAGSSTCDVEPIPFRIGSSSPTHCFTRNACAATKPTAFLQKSDTRYL